MRNRAGYFCKRFNEEFKDHNFVRYENSLCRVMGDSYQMISFEMSSRWAFSVIARLELLYEPWLVHCPIIGSNLFCLLKTFDERFSGFYNNDEEFMQQVDYTMAAMKSNVMPIFNSATTVSAVRKSILDLVDLEYNNRYFSEKLSIKNSAESFKDYLLNHANNMTLLTCDVIEKQEKAILGRLYRLIEHDEKAFKKLSPIFEKFKDSNHCLYTSENMCDLGDLTMFDPETVQRYINWRNIEWCVVNNDYDWVDNVYLPRNKEANIAELKKLGIIK